MKTPAELIKEGDEWCERSGNTWSWAGRNWPDIRTHLARSEDFDQVTHAFGEHPDTGVDFIVERILELRAIARRSANTLSEQVSRQEGQ